MAQPLDNLTRTWAIGATESGIKLSVTDPGAAAASNLLELRGGAAGTTTRFALDKSGGATLYTSATDGVKLFSSQSALGIIPYSGGAQLYLDGANRRISSNSTLQLNDGNGVSIDATDLVLRRDAANTLAQRITGTNPQVFRIYNTFTDTLNNFERGKIAWESNILRIGTEKGLTAGTARALEFQTDGTTRLTISTDGIVTTSGAFNSSNKSGVNTAGYLGSWVGGRIGFTNSAGWFASVLLDTYISRSEAGVLAITSAAELTEMTAPAAPAANKVRIYAEDDGAGKTRLMALFATGVAQQLAIEP